MNEKICKDNSEKRVLFQNDACLVINKLPGESSEFPRLGAAMQGEKFPVPVHRLDMPVSGCLLLANNEAAAAFLGAAFASYDKTEKRYWAIVEKSDAAIPMQAELVHWLGENKKLNKAFALQSRQNEGQKKAVMRYRVAGQGDHYLFLEIDLVTGRHHQIRAQLAAIGLHIKGDLKYGARRSEKNGGIRLHSFSLGFPNPLNADEIIRVKAPPPYLDPLWEAFIQAVDI